MPQTQLLHGAQPAAGAPSRSGPAAPQRSAPDAAQHAVYSKHGGKGDCQGGGEARGLGHGGAQRGQRGVRAAGGQEAGQEVRQYASEALVQRGHRGWAPQQARPSRLHRHAMPPTCTRERRCQSSGLCPRSVCGAQAAAAGQEEPEKAGEQTVGLEQARQHHRSQGPLPAHALPGGAPAAALRCARGPAPAAPAPSPAPNREGAERRWLVGR